MTRAEIESQLKKITRKYLLKIIEDALTDEELLDVIMYHIQESELMEIIEGY